MQTFGRYIIKRELGQGGMGNVYLAHDPQFGRDVAVKVLPPGLLQEKGFLERFQNEARLLARLQHHAIVPVYDFGEDNHRPYLVMQLMEGGSLADRLEHQPLSPEATSRILRRICSALEAAHQEGIVHRDLKPANILFDKHGEAYLGDFGIAKITEGSQTVTLIGTPQYMAPEQAHGFPLDQRVDIYQMGIVLFEMVTGRVPFTANTSAAYLYHHVHTPAPPIQQFNPRLSPAINNVIQRAMAKDREERFPTANELSIAFDQAINVPAPTKVHAAHPVATQTTPKSRPWPLILGGFGIISIIGLVIIALLLVSFFNNRANVATILTPTATTEATATSSPTTLATDIPQPTTTTQPEPTTTTATIIESTAPAGEPFTCTDELGCVRIEPNDPILLASALVISGPNSILGLDSQYGVEIALEMQGTLLGHPLELQTEDDGCSPEGGQTAGEQIVTNPQIVAVIGSSCSGAAVPMSEIIAEAGYVMVSPSNTAPVLTSPEFHQAGYLRVSHNDQLQGQTMAEFAYNELGKRRVGLIHDGDPYTEGLASVFRDEFTALGGTVVAFEGAAPSASDITPLLTTIASNEPDIIYYPVFTELGALITRTANEVAGLEAVTLSAADGVLTPTFVNTAGSASEGMYLSGPNLNFSGPLYDNFLALYQENYGEEPTAPFHAHAFDATNMILTAIEAVAQQDAAGTLLIGRQALRTALFATSGLEGITGTISCNNLGDCANVSIDVYQVQNGDFVAIWP